MTQTKWGITESLLSMEAIFIDKAVIAKRERSLNVDIFM